MKNIQIEGPGFYGEDDENLFFQCIYNLPGFHNVRGVGTVLTISFKEDVTTEARDLIQALCVRWETNLCG